MKLLRSVALCIALSAPALSTASAQDAISLQQKWDVGNRYRQSVTMHQTTTVPAGDQSFEQVMDVVTEATLAVSKHEDGKRKKLGIKYDRFAMDMTMGPQKMSFDTSKPGGEPALVGLSKMVGKEVRVIIDEKDQPVDIEDPEGLLNSAGANPGMEEFVNADSFKEIVRSASLAALPEKPVKPGESWPFSVDTPLAGLGSASVKGQYTFKGMVDRGGVQMAEIVAEAKFSINFSSGDADDNSAPNPLKALNMKIDDSVMNATIWFDPALGMTRESETNQTINMTMDNPGQPGAVLKLPIKQKIITKMTPAEGAK